MSNKNENSVVAAVEATVENGNVAAEAQVVNPTDAPAVGPAPAPAVAPAAYQPETIEAIVARLCKDGKSVVVKTAITAVECEERTAKNGTKYINTFVNLETPVRGSQKLADGTYRIGLLGAIQFPFNSLLLVMRKHRFYGRFVASLEDAARVNMVADYLAGIEISIFCQFVAAGELGRNPFTRNANEYDVADHDRYIYHVVGIEAPTDPIVLDDYRMLRAEQAAARKDAIAAMRKAVATTANLLSAATVADDMPF